MAITGVSTTRITSGARGDKRTTSCAGVPGTGLPAAYAYVNLDVKLAATDAGALYVALSNGQVVQDHMSNAVDRLNPWHLFAIAKTSAFTFTVPVGATELWQYAQGDAFGEWPWWSGEENFDFTGNTSFAAVADPTSESDATSKGYALLPFKVSDLDVTTTIEGGVQKTTAPVYLAMPILYQWSSATTSAVTIASVRFSLDVSEIVDYFPFAIRKDGQFVSANRSGGSTTLRVGGSWRDVRNSEGAGYDNKAFYRTGGSWVRAPRLGAQ